MRSFVTMAMVLAASSTLAASDYTETRDIAVDASGATRFVIDAGAGSLEVTGVAGQDAIEVKATIVIYDADEAEGREVIDKSMKLNLERNGAVAKLEAGFKERFWGMGTNGSIKLEITAPATLALDIDDGSGSIKLAGFVSDVTIDDGSGSISVNGGGALEIDDGSGSIDVTDAAGDVTISDGSGSIRVERIGGSVTIDDGSGSIRVNDVAGDLEIIDAGSGSVSISNVQGTVEQDR